MLSRASQHTHTVTVGRSKVADHKSMIAFFCLLTSMSSSLNLTMFPRSWNGKSHTYYNNLLFWGLEIRPVDAKLAHFVQCQVYLYFFYVM